MLFLSVVALIVIQTFQIVQLYDRKESQFDDKVNECLNRIAYSHEKAVDQRISKQIANRGLGEYKDIIKNEFTPEEVTSIRDTNIYVRGKRKRYFILQGEVFDTISGISAQQKVLIRDVRNYKDLELKGDTSRLAIDLDPNTRGSLESKIRYLDSLIIRAFRNNTDFSNDFNLDIKFLDSIISSEFKKEGLPLNYSFLVKNQKITTKNQSSHYDKDIKISEETYITGLFPNNIFKGDVQLIVEFPQKENYLYAEMSYTFMATGALVIFIVIALIFMFKTIMQQKKFSELKSDFISNMTHEFKTPIATISLACQAASDKDVIGEKTESNQIEPLIDVIKTENKRLELLVESILQSAVVDKGNFNGKIEKINLQEVIQNQLENTRFRLKPKNGQTFYSKSNEEFVIKADHVHVTNLVANLLDNAVKYSSETPIINVELIKVDNRIKLRIEDNGLGIKQEHLPKIFDKLFRVPTGNIHNVKGFGLGLSYVKSICDNYGWKIFVESTFGEGTTFEIHF